MKKGKLMLSMVMVMAMFSVTGCQGSQETTQATSENTDAAETTQATTQEDTEKTVSVDEGEKVTDSSGIGAGRVYTNDYGFTVTYDDTIFEMIADEGCNTLQLMNQDMENEIPVYVAFQVIENSTVEDIAEGVRAQSEVVSDTTEATVGSGNYEAKSFIQTMNLDIGEQSVTFYLLQYNTEVIMIEKGCATEEDAQREALLQEILDSFTLE